MSHYTSKQLFTIFTVFTFSSTCFAQDVISTQKFSKPTADCLVKEYQVPAPGYGSTDVIVLDEYHVYAELSPSSNTESSERILTTKTWGTNQKPIDMALHFHKTAGRGVMNPTRYALRIIQNTPQQQTLETYFFSTRSENKTVIIPTWKYMARHTEIHGQFWYYVDQVRLSISCEVIFPKPSSLKKDDSNHQRVYY